jgi:hypothetical protein
LVPLGPSAGTAAGSIVALPSFREIPECLFPLRSAGAQREYDEIARVLFDAGRMTIGAHRALCSYAMQFDAICRTADDGRVIRNSAFTQLDKARMALGLDDLDKRIAAPDGAQENKFARAGFSARR